MPQIDPQANGPSARPPHGGRDWWRSLEERADDPDFRKMVEREFPSQASVLKDAHSRRGFLQLMGASLGLAGLTGCRWPKENILPFAHRPAGRVPGVATQFATAADTGGAVQGLLVTSMDGRPIKVEGNPGHPLNRGAADARAQALVLGLYDPDRSQEFVRFERGRRFVSDWDGFLAFARPRLGLLRGARGRGLRVLAPSTASPTLEDVRGRLLAALPDAHWHVWDPVSRANEREGARLAFGTPVRTHFDFSEAEVIVSFDADFLADDPAAVRHAREFAAARRADAGRMNRLHVIESGFSITGAMADHRTPYASSGIPVAVSRVAGEVARLLLADPAVGLPPETAQILRAHLERFETRSFAVPFAARIARDLVQARGEGLVVVGPQQPAEVHALGHLLNAALGNAGRTVRYTSEPGDPAESIGALAEAMRAGSVDTLVILGGNPVYDAPAGLAFGEAMKSVPARIRLGLYEDETTAACAGAGLTWHVPQAHDLESWGDLRAWDGTLTVVQPLIDPLYDGRTPIEVVSVLSGDPVEKGYGLVRRTLASFLGMNEGDPRFEPRWRTVLAEGMLAESASPFEEPRMDPLRIEPALAALPSVPPELGPGNLELVFRPDSKVFDGRFANNGWLQETPGPMTRLTWGNAALVGPATAAALGVASDDVVRLTLEGRAVEIPVLVLPGQAPFSITLPLGYGRTAAGRVGNGIGTNTNGLRPLPGASIVTGASLARTGATGKLACTQDHHALDRLALGAIEERKAVLIREATVEEYREHPGFAQEGAEHPPLVSLWKERRGDGPQWGMAIDLNACNGCNACVVACTAENNVPVVGRERVLEGREMHWIRVDRYFSGDPENPAAAHQPMACVHCENAPCEQVCPVGATMHDREGLNVQVYNRCIGTRYCANNCPYKVRRFNFFNYRKHLSSTEQMAMNPDVTVRSRGVMEKCTYCVQRIETAKIAARNEGRPVRDGEIVPACAQACPPQAIVFGDLGDPESRVARLHGHARSYAVLEELNTKPRTRYLARLRNPMPVGEADAS